MLMVPAGKELGALASSNAARVLVVEDDYDSAEALASILEYAGYDVRVTSSGIGASAVARTFQPSTAIVDLGLPDISGFAVVDSIRQLPDLESCRFIAVTAFVGDGLVEQSLAAGFAAHFTKPLELRHLLSLLADGLGTSGLKPNA